MDKPASGMGIDNRHCSNGGGNDRYGIDSATHPQETSREMEDITDLDREIFTFILWPGHERLLGCTQMSFQNEGITDILMRVALLARKADIHLGQLAGSQLEWGQYSALRHQLRMEEWRRKQCLNNKPGNGP